MQQKVLNRFM